MQRRIDQIWSPAQVVKTSPAAFGNFQRRLRSGPKIGALSLVDLLDARQLVDCLCGIARDGLEVRDISCNSAIRSIDAKSRAQLRPTHDH